MYNTCSVKDQWQTVFCCGNPDAKEVVLILGSCRVVPYLNYFDQANAVCGNRFKIYAIDPINYVIDAAGNMLDTAGLLKALETDERFLSILRSVTIFVHEWLESFGILNTATPGIYDFGMAPRIDVTLANFHDVFLMFKDFAQFDPTLTGELTEEQQLRVFQEGEAHIERFCNICLKSSFPDFGAWFRENWLRVRLFHSFNHVSSAFTLELFRRANEQFLHLPLDDAYWTRIGSVDLYGNVSTPLCTYDVKWRPYSWPDEPIVDLF